MSRIRGPYVRFCERDEAVTPHPTQFAVIGYERLFFRLFVQIALQLLDIERFRVVVAL